MRSLADVRPLFRADAGFEAVFGSLLIAGAGAGIIAASDIPVARGVIVLGGIAFLGASASQLFYFVKAPRRILLELAVGNAAMAVAGLTWLLLDRGFSTGGATLLAAASAWKLAIGLIQVRSLRRVALQH
jgi:hypothetical protein